MYAYLKLLKTFSQYLAKNDSKLSLTFYHQKYQMNLDESNLKYQDEMVQAAWLEVNLNCCLPQKHAIG